MSLVRPFRGLLPRPEDAARVAAPPYDVLTSDEARRYARGNALSFLHISKPEIDLPTGTDPYAPAVYAKAQENFQRLLAQGVLRRDREACYYAYRLTLGTHVQTGVAAAASVEAYERGDIRRHEFTRPDKEDDRVRQIDALNAQTGPVLLAYRASEAVERVLRGATQAAPDLEAVLDPVTEGASSVRHQLWRIAAPEAVAALSSAFEVCGRLYIADGHHRSAAAARVAASRRARGQGDAEASHNYFLAVMFPDREMRILDYNRVVTDLNGLSPGEFLNAVGARFAVEPSDTAVRPNANGEFGMYLGARWYRLRVPPARIPADPVAGLDVSLLARELLQPILGIEDPRRDRRIDFVGGVRGLGELQRRVDGGGMAVAFSVCPTSLAQLMAVADAGEIMPPKSTWFEPKLADGLVSHVLD